MEDINALDEIHKGSCMGVDAISFILDKVEDKSLENILRKQYKSYKEICSRIEDMYPKYNEGKPHSTSMPEKVMTDYMINMKLLVDKTTSHIAELLIQGTNMGIIEGRRILNKKNINEEVNSLVTEYVTMQEKYLDNLKKYL
ncbi:MAG: hypothetical protein IJ068_01515 [Bacilli bacterium]|nr:hypothetical protein [Bacilli bacterium]